MRNLTKPYINFAEYWTSMKIASNVGKERVTKSLKRLLGGYTQDCILKGIWLRWQIPKESTNNQRQNLFRHFALKSLSDILPSLSHSLHAM